MQPVSNLYKSNTHDDERDVIRDKCIRIRRVSEISHGWRSSITDFTVDFKLNMNLMRLSPKLFFNVKGSGPQKSFGSYSERFLFMM